MSKRTNEWFAEGLEQMADDRDRELIEIAERREARRVEESNVAQLFGDCIVGAARKSADTSEVPDDAA